MTETICPVCGLRYSALRTGLTFRKVRRMMISASPDPRDWRHKRRRSVLGYWRELKLMEWRYHLDACEHYSRGAA